jgi:hypothetical protein
MRFLQLAVSLVDILIPYGPTKCSHKGTTVTSHRCEWVNVSQRRRRCHGPATSSRARGSVCPGPFPGGPEAAISRADDAEVVPTVQLLKAWLPVYHAVDTGEVALRLTRALAA